MVLTQIFKKQMSVCLEMQIGQEGRKGRIINTHKEMTNTYIKPHRMYLKCISLNTKKINKTMQVLEENLGKLLYILTVVGGAFQISLSQETKG